MNRFRDELNYGKMDQSRKKRKDFQIRGVEDHQKVAVGKCTVICECSLHVSVCCLR